MDGKKCVPASVGLRIANFIIDAILSFFFGGILTLVFAIFVHDFFKLYVFYYLVTLFQVYFIFFEGTWQRTPGKWITGTKVVRKDGHAPTFGQVLGRSFSRLVPFEAFSFLVGPNPRGWHDRFTKTLVVANECTVADVANIDWDELKKKTSYKALYIVLGIFGGLFVLGIVASITLVALGSAQAKSHDSRIMATVSDMRGQALAWTPIGGPQYQDLTTEEITEGTDTKGTLFTDNIPEDHSLYSLISKLPHDTYYFYGAEDKLPSEGGRWVFAATVSGDDYVCVDYTGAMSRVTKPGKDIEWPDVFPQIMNDATCN